MTKTQYDRPTQEDELRLLTGIRFAPLFTWQGRDVYPVQGAEGDDESGTGDPDGESGDDADDDAGSGTSDGGSDTVTREEFEKLRKQLSAADKNKSAAEKKLKEIEDAKKDELTKATERAAELEKTVTAQAKELADMRLQNAFLTAETGVTWHDPSDALALAERQGYLAEVVGEDGAVDKAKLKAKLQELAKAKPHLVKNDGASSNGTGKKDTDTPPASGGKVGSKGSSGGQKKENIPSRYQRFLT